MSTVALIPWSDTEIARGIKRMALFQRRGVTEERAEQMVDECRRRDLERGDWHYCIECSSLQQSGHCFAAKQGRVIGGARNYEPVRDVFVRCPTFQWQKA